MVNSSTNFDSTFISEINTLLFYDVWENEELTTEQRELLKNLIKDNYHFLYGRKINKEIIHIGLNHPSTNEINGQTLMFGPAGNFSKNPEIIITGISTSITAANGIANRLRCCNLDTITAVNLRNIYLENIYKGNMYTKFKREWINRSENSTYESSFLDLFNMIEGKKPAIVKNNIMVTQMTLHGIATFYDKRHDRYTWYAPSTEVFNNEPSKLLFDNYFLNSVLKKSFLENPKAKYLFIMGNDAYRKLKKAFKDNEYSLYLKNGCVEFIDTMEYDFKISNLNLDSNRKYIIKIKHSAA